MNRKLFHLGNECVRIRQKIDETFPKSYLNGRNELGECFNEILEFINKIRIIIQEAKDPEQFYQIKFNCSNDEILSIKELLHKLEIPYSLRKLTSENQE